jgi:predicted ribosomally synthesized peptide with nif11-like leader
MNETLTNFRKAVSDSTDLQEKVKAGADLVALGKENGYEFTQEELNAGWTELQESDEGLTEFELDVVSGGRRATGLFKLERVTGIKVIIPIPTSPSQST